MKAARVSLVVAAAQAVLIVAGLVALPMVTRARILGVPSLLGPFLPPAPIAKCVRLARASRAAKATPLAAAFPTLPPRAVLPVSPAEGETMSEGLRPFQQSAGDRTRA